MLTCPGCSRAGGVLVWGGQPTQEEPMSLKPTDAVIVGIYDRYSDQPAENAAYVRRFGSGKSAG